MGQYAAKTEVSSEKTRAEIEHTLIRYGADAQISTFEDEFMAHIVMPNGHTIGETIRPQIAMAYESGTMQRMLPEWSAE